MSEDIMAGMIRHPQNPDQALEIKQLIAPSVPMWARIDFSPERSFKRSPLFKPVLTLALCKNEKGEDEIMGICYASETTSWEAVDNSDGFEGYVTELPEDALLRQD